MRKITLQATNALLNDQNYKGSNTIVKGGQMFLFGNLIAETNSIFKNDGNKAINITNRGYFTATTKERLNALPGVHIVQKAGVWYLNGNEWDGSWITVTEDGKIIK